MHRSLLPSNILLFSERKLLALKNLFKLTESSIGIPIEEGFEGAYQKGVSEYSSKQLKHTGSPPEEMIRKEDTFSYGITLFQFVCGLTIAELRHVRQTKGDQFSPKMEFMTYLLNEIPDARTRNLDRLVQEIIA